MQFDVAVFSISRLTFPFLAALTIPLGVDWAILTVC
jgi:hypothetical protein